MPALLRLPSLVFLFAAFIIPRLLKNAREEVNCYQLILAIYFWVVQDRLTLDFVEKKRKLCYDRIVFIMR